MGQQSAGKGGGDGGAGAQQAKFEQQQQDYNLKLQENQNKFNQDIQAQNDAREAAQTVRDNEKKQQDAELLKLNNEEISAKYKKFYGRETSVDSSTPLVNRGA
jgi:hypothetical protein